MNLFIQIIILFILIFIYLKISDPHDNSNWLRSMILAVALPVLALTPQYTGLIGWFVALIIALILISKLLGESLGGSLLFLMVIGLIQAAIQFGIDDLVNRIF